MISSCPSDASLSQGFPFVRVITLSPCDFPLSRWIPFVRTIPFARVISLCPVGFPLFGLFPLPARFLLFRVISPFPGDYCLSEMTAHSSSAKLARNPVESNQRPQRLLQEKGWGGGGEREREIRSGRLCGRDVCPFRRGVSSQTQDCRTGRLPLIQTRCDRRWWRPFKTEFRRWINDAGLTVSAYGMLAVFFFYQRSSVGRYRCPSVAERG